VCLLFDFESTFSLQFQVESISSATTLQFHCKICRTLFCVRSGPGKHGPVFSKRIECHLRLCCNRCTQADDVAQPSVEVASSEAGIWLAYTTFPSRLAAHES